MEQENLTLITKLPNELILLILRNNDCGDIMNFASTCKSFTRLINNNQFLWKEKLKSMIPNQMFHVMTKLGCKYDWFQEVKNFHIMQKKIHLEIISMTSKCLWEMEPTLNDVKNSFYIALSNNVSYLYTIHILQNLIKKGKYLTDKNLCIVPFTLTEMYYAECVLQYLIHTFLCMKWTQKQMKSQLTPEIVLYVFTQWVDLERIHSEEDIEEKISDIVNEVEVLLLKNNSVRSSPLEIHEMVAQKLVHEKTVLEAISEVIYYYRGMTTTRRANLETIDMEQVLDNNYGNAITVAIIYYYVAKRCGVHCEVKHFPYHFFLEWRDTSHKPKPQIYTIDLDSGEVRKQRNCPSVNRDAETNGYNPNALVQCLLNVYMKPMSDLNQSVSQNCLELLYFIDIASTQFDTDQSDTYLRYRRFLQNDVSMATLPNIDLYYIRDEHLYTLSILSNLAKKSVNNRHITTPVTKKRESSVKYAVGMVCYHKEYHYSSVIVGWDTICNNVWKGYPSNKELRLGIKQPFYSVISMDQTKRYIAQENLMDITHTSRVLNIEHMICRYFTHFNGFAYVPNKELSEVYPDDIPISELFRSRAENKIGMVF